MLGKDNRIDISYPVDQNGAGTTLRSLSSSALSSVPASALSTFSDCPDRLGITRNVKGYKMEAGGHFPS
jgi:hypothetical protein